jgi:NADH dehydrogenase
LSQKAATQLKALGVFLHIGSPVIDLDAQSVTLASRQRIESATIIWAAGVKPVVIVRNLMAAHDPHSRVLVGPDLSVPGHPEAFVAGDVAHVEQRGQVLPGIAPVAIQQGRTAAENIMRSVRGLPRVAFRYQDRGMLAVIGRRRGVGIVFGAHVSGFMAWLLWALVHIAYLIGFRNRVAVMTEWLWNYVTFKRGARVIEGLHPTREPRALRP